MKRVNEERKFWDEFAKQDDIELKIADPKIPVDSVIEALTKDVSVGNNILEIGCGTGRLSIMFALKYPEAQVTGIDISAEMIKHAQQKLIKRYENTKEEIKNLDFYSTNGRKLPVGKKYSFIFSHTVFQHIDEEGVKKYLSEVADKLRKNGTFRFQFGEGIERSGYSQNFTVAEMTEWCAKVGLVVKKIDQNLICPNWTFFTCSKK